MAEPKDPKSPQKPPPPTVDCDFPGGNIVVKRIEGETVFVRQDLRDTKGWWFYWYFRVRHAAGRSLTFRFDNPRSFTVRGPAVSTDGGKTWSWLGAECVKDAAFTYRFSAKADDVRFSMAMPYVQSTLREFLRALPAGKHLKVETHCKTRKGRLCQRLRFGRLDGQCAHRVLLTCRHHACEMMASYVLEGLLAAALADTDDGRWLRGNVEFLAVPFMDADGVADGDQGKNRKPHDHNRDYRGQSIYPSVRALRELVPTWSGGRLRIAIDMHCPYIRGGANDQIFLVGGPSHDNWKRTRRFGEVLKGAQSGSLRYSGNFDIPHGVSWNKTAVGPCGKWTEGLDGIWVATSIEIPYARAGGKDVTAQTARTFGQGLARAMRRFLAAGPADAK